MLSGRPSRYHIPAHWWYYIKLWCIAFTLSTPNFNRLYQARLLLLVDLEERAAILDVGDDRHFLFAGSGRLGSSHIVRHSIGRSTLDETETVLPRMGQLIYRDNCFRLSR